MRAKKEYKQRTYLDPINLNLNDPTDYLLTEIINTREFQRLRRIRQMGLGAFTFHGAEHSRFGHSLGTMFIAKKMINHLSNNFPEIKKYKTEILICALIHDIGHGPFSHTSEKIIDSTHEILSKKIIEGNSNINSILSSHKKDLPEKITDILRHSRSPKYLSQIISSYIDCDRLDYLHRDSYFVGVPYGLTGSERIIASLAIDKEKLVINESIGLDAVIHYLQARHSMYVQVYQHKKNLACDFLLKKIFKRVREVKPINISIHLNKWLNHDKRGIDIDSYLHVDDILLISNFQMWAFDPTEDAILRNLTKNFLERRLFKSLEFRPQITKNKINEILEKLKKISKNKRIDPDYYVGIEQSASKPYEPYKAQDKKTSKAIYIKQQNGTIQELSEISGLVKALSKEGTVKTCLVFTPELENEVRKLKGSKELFK